MTFIHGLTLKNSWRNVTDFNFSHPMFISVVGDYMSSKAMLGFDKLCAVWTRVA